MISLRIILGLFHLTCVIRTGSSCGGNFALKGVEMCKGGSTTDNHFYLHGSPAGDLQRCDCNLIITGVATTMSFTPVNVTNNATTCGGTLTLPDGTMKECGWTSTTSPFMYPGTKVLSFAYSDPDMKFCVEVKLIAAETNISIECPLSITTTTQLSPLTSMAPQTTTVNVISSLIPTTTASPATTSQLHTVNFTSSSASTPSLTNPLPTPTSTTVSASTTKSTRVSSSENRPTSPVTNTQSSTEDGEPEGTTVEQTSFPVAAVVGGVGAGLLLLLVVVIVVILCYRRGRHVEKHEDDKQEESKGPTEVITVTNSLYESSADINNTQPSKPLTTVEQQVSNPMVKGQLPPRLTSDITPDIEDQHNGKPSVADQHGGRTGSNALQDETPDEHRDGTSDMYAVVIKPKKSLVATKVTKQAVHTDPENVSKDMSPPPIDATAIYANVNKPSPKTKKL